MRKNLWRLSWLYKDDNGNKNKKRDRETNTLNNPKINKGKNNDVDREFIERKERFTDRHTKK